MFINKADRYKILSIFEYQTAIVDSNCKQKKLTNYVPFARIVEVVNLITKVPFFLCEKSLFFAISGKKLSE